MKKKTQTKKGNWKGYVAIVLAAIIFWFIAKINKKYDHTVDIPLNIILNNPDYTLKHPAPDNIRVNIVGRGFDILRLPFYEPTFDIDLSNVEDRYQFIPNDYLNNVRLPEELQISVKSVLSPHEIDLDLDKRVSVKLPVKVAAAVQTKAGFTLVNATTNPDSVTITGPAVYLDSLSAILTAPAAHKDIGAAFREELDIRTNAQFYTRTDVHRVDVFYNVQRLAEKELTAVPVNVINVPANFEVVPLPGYARIYSKGGEKVLAASTAEDFKVVIDFRNWRPDAERMTPEITTDLAVRHYSCTPPDFELIVQKKRK